MAREMRLELEKAGSSGGSEALMMCGRCGRIGESNWKHCPYDGMALTEKELD